MDYAFFAIVLLMVGFSLIIAEIFLPSGGLIFIMCLIAFAASLWCATKAWYGTAPIAFGVYIASTVLLIPTVIIGAFKIFPMTPMGKKWMGAPTTAEVTPYVEEQAHLASLIGRIGKTITPLIPGGMVGIDGERLHAFSEGVLIDPGVDVEIMDVRGTRVMVREAIELPPREPVLEAENPIDSPATNTLLAQDADGSSDEANPLDFDVPQG